MVMVNLYAAARSAMGQAKFHSEASTLNELIYTLSSQNEAMKKLLPTCSYLLNSQACHDLSQSLLEHDEIDVLPQFAGG